MLGLSSATLLILVLTAPLTAQITFQRTYGGTSVDEGNSVAQTTDSGYVIAGYTYSSGAGGSDVYLVKTDASGDTMWTRTYGGGNDDRGRSIRQTADGGYIITGYTCSFGAGEYDVWLIKTNASGDTVWTRTYGGTNWDWGRSVQQTADGGYIIAGSTRSFGADYWDVWLIKTNANGDSIWTRTFGGTGYDYGNSVQQTADAGYIIAGCTYSFGSGRDVWLIKTDASGDTMWTRTYGGWWNDSRGYSVQQTADSGYVITGETWSYRDGYEDVYLVKTDASGNTMWTRTYGGTASDVAHSVQQTADGGYVVAGCTNSFGAGEYDVWLIKTNNSGGMMWAQTFGGADYDQGRSVAQTADGGYVIAGWTWSFGAGSDDVYLIKTDPDGNVAIAEPKPPVAFEPAGATIVRGVLNLQSEIRNLKSEFVLLNSAGRKVMDLTPGENDIRHLSPGVYFIRGKGSRGRGSEGPSRRVILTR